MMMIMIMLIKYLLEQSYEEFYGCLRKRLGWKKFGRINISKEENIKASQGARPPRNKDFLI
jgi:hypothetical protein